jgi:hypothetical protein
MLKADMEPEELFETKPFLTYTHICTRRVVIRHMRVNVEA